MMLCFREEKGGTKGGAKEGDKRGTKGGQKGERERANERERESQKVLKHILLFSLWYQGELMVAILSLNLRTRRPNLGLRSACGSRGRSGVQPGGGRGDGTAVIGGSPTPDPVEIQPVVKGRVPLAMIQAQAERVRAGQATCHGGGSTALCAPPRRAAAAGADTEGGRRS